MSPPQQAPLKMCFIPIYSATSHIIPFIDIARYLSFHGQKISILATPTNANLIKQLLINKTSSLSDQKIVVHIIPIPLKEAGLPEDYDHLNKARTQNILTDFVLRLNCTRDLFRYAVQKFLEESEPFDCIVADLMYPWCAEVADHFKIPSISFNPFSVFSLCVREALRLPKSPEESFVIPGLEDGAKNFILEGESFQNFDDVSPSGLHVPITLTKAENPPEEFQSIIMEPGRVGELKCDLILFNSFMELERNSMKYFEKITGKKVVAIGSASEIHRKISGGMIERGQKIIDKNNEHCLSWLENKKPNSVIYINFGSIVKLPNEQLMEIAFALESSGHNFIWVALRNDEESNNNNETDDEGTWLPMGFYKKIKERGLVIKSWAPQLSILSHPSVGGFMTHCGWNSILEGFGAGVPMITWPLTYEQFYNEKVVTQMVRAGVEVGAKEWAYWYDVGKKIIGREKIEMAVRKLMDGGDEIERMRKKVEEYGEMAKRAVEEGGSTYKSMVNLIEAVKDIRVKYGRTI